MSENNSHALKTWIHNTKHVWFGHQPWTGAIFQKSFGLRQIIGLSLYNDLLLAYP